MSAQMTAAAAAADAHDMTSVEAMMSRSTPLPTHNVDHRSASKLSSASSVERLRSCTAASRLSHDESECDVAPVSGRSGLGKEGSTHEPETLDIMGPTTSALNTGGGPHMRIRRLRRSRHSAKIPAESSEALGSPASANSSTLSLPQISPPGIKSDAAATCNSSPASITIQTPTADEARHGGAVLDRKSAVTAADKLEENDRKSDLTTEARRVEHEARKAWNSYLSHNDSVVTDIFAGQLQGTVECTECKHR